MNAPWRARARGAHPVDIGIRIAPCHIHQTSLTVTTDGYLLQLI
jgi:hypothetical protein